MRTRQVCNEAAARVLRGWHNVKLFAFRPSDRTRIYVVVDSLNWLSSLSNLCLYVPTPSILAHYSSLALQSEDRYRQLLLTAALTEVSVCTVLRFLLAARQGVISTFGEDSYLIVSQPDLLTVSNDLGQVVSELLFLEVVRRTSFDAAWS